ncbi:MAG TPA: CHRD domain-containing protein, partial [Candidatus Didemnitutus sp.]|nr:CHRD domain-containing protein [Candidatus Didemnitutus sp.]
MNYTSSRTVVRGLLATALLALVSGSVFGGTLYIGRLNGANENPPNNSTWTGTGILILNDAETIGTVTATHNITDPVTGGHIHMGVAGVNAPVVFPFPAPSSPVGPLTWNMTQAQVDALKNQGLYMNFHTALFPGGVIRSTMFRALLAPAAMTPAQMRLANALDISAGYNSDLDQILITTNLAPTATQTATLTDLGGGTLYVQTRQQLEAATNFENTLFSYADDMRATNTTNDGFAGFLRLGDQFGSRDASPNQIGSDVSRPFALAGVDWKVGPNTHLGLALGYASGKDDFDGGVGTTKVKTTSLNGFVSFGLGGSGIVLDGLAGY